MRARSPRTRGFTLLELVVVAAIIAILAAAAIPSFTNLVHKSRRAEAYAALRGIYQLQTQYYGRHGVYTDSFDELGFALDGGQRTDASTIVGPYYTYTLETKSLDGRPKANFRATATGDIDPSDPVLDVVIIENRLTVKR